jgi:hypothetical protein
MDISEVRKRVLHTIDRAKREAAQRRARSDLSSREYAEFLDRIAVPLFHQVARALRAEGHNFNVFTPGGSVRLSSERAVEDYIELVLDTSGATPQVVGHCSRIRGRRVLETERPISDKAIASLGDEDVLEFLLTELEPFVER